MVNGNRCPEMLMKAKVLSVKCAQTWDSEYCLNSNNNICYCTVKLVFTLNVYCF